jgi:hypothetical protein
MFCKRSWIILTALVACSSPSVADRKLPGNVHGTYKLSRSHEDSIKTDSATVSPRMHSYLIETNTPTRPIVDAALESALKAEFENEHRKALALGQRAYSLLARRQALAALGPNGVGLLQRADAPNSPRRTGPGGSGFSRPTTSWPSAW